MGTRLKMQCTSVQQVMSTDKKSVDSEQIRFECVFGDKDGKGVNAVWSKFTPSGTLQFSVTNPDVIGTIKAGAFYLVDLHECDAEA